MGVDEDGRRFFHVNVPMILPRAGETYTALQVGDTMVIAAGPIVILTRGLAETINEKSKSGGFFPGIIERISRGKISG